MLWMDGGQSQASPLQRRDRPSGQSEQETVVIFTVFQGCLQCRSLRGANQNVKNKDTTCQSFRLRVGFYFLCAKGALTLSSIPEHTLTHPHYGCLAHSRVKRPHWHPRFKSTSTRPGPSPCTPPTSHPSSSFCFTLCRTSFTSPQLPPSVGRRSRGDL